MRVWAIESPRNIKWIGQNWEKTFLCFLAIRREQRVELCVAGGSVIHCDSIFAHRLRRWPSIEPPQGNVLWWRWYRTPPFCIVWQDYFIIFQIMKAMQQLLLTDRFVTRSLSFCPRLLQESNRQYPHCRPHPSRPIPSRLEALTKCWFNVWPVSKTVGQHRINIFSMYNIFWITPPNVGLYIGPTSSLDTQVASGDHACTTSEITFPLKMRRSIYRLL